MFEACGCNLVRSSGAQGAVEVAATTLPSLQRFMRLHAARGASHTAPAAGVAHLREQERHEQTMFFIVTFVLPGPPEMSFIMVFKRSVPRGVDRAFDVLWARFLDGDDEFKNSRFKFACRLLSAPWLVKTAMATLGGVRPSILGRKLRTEYTHAPGSGGGGGLEGAAGRGADPLAPRYLEASVYVNSSVVARKIFSLVSGGAPQIAMEFAFFIEGVEEAELPERLIGCFRLCHASVAGMAAPYPATQGPATQEPAAAQC